MVENGRGELTESRKLRIENTSIAGKIIYGR